MKEYVILRVEYSTKFLYTRGDNIMKGEIKQDNTGILISKKNIFLTLLFLNFSSFDMHDIHFN